MLGFILVVIGIGGVIQGVIGIHYKEFILYGRSFSTQMFKGKQARLVSYILFFLSYIALLAGIAILIFDRYLGLSI